VVASSGLLRFLNFHAAIPYGSLLRHNAACLETGMKSSASRPDFVRGDRTSREFSVIVDPIRSHVCGHFFGDRERNRRRPFRASVEAEAQGFVLRAMPTGSIGMHLRPSTTDGDEAGAKPILCSENGSIICRFSKPEASVQRSETRERQTGAQQRFMIIAETHFPWQAGVFDGVSGEESRARRWCPRCL